MKRTILLVPILIVSALLQRPIISHAQQATLTVTVTANGSALAKATVTIYSSQNSQFDEKKTNADGTATLKTPTEPGFRVEVSKVGYAYVSTPGDWIKDGKLTVDITPRRPPKQ